MRRNPLRALVGAAAVLVALSAAELHLSGTPSTPRSPTEEPQIAANPGTPGGAEPSAPASTPSQTADARLAAIRRQWPLRERVRAEAAEYPHVPSALVLAFARELGGVFELARGDAAFARKLVAVLGDCVRADAVADAARAVCLLRARRLPSLHPGDERLRQAAERVGDAAPPRLGAAVDALEQTQN